MTEHVSSGSKDNLWESLWFNVFQSVEKCTLWEGLFYNVKASLWIIVRGHSSWVTDHDCFPVSMRYKSIFHYFLTKGLVESKYKGCLYVYQNTEWHLRPLKRHCTCCRNAMSMLVPHLSGFGRLMSLRYRISLSASLGRYTRPLLVLIT